MASLFADENFPFPVVAHLHRLGHDVRTIQEAGHSGRGVGDETVLRLGIAEARAILTYNRRHFVKLHERFPDHHGIVVCTRDEDFRGLAQRIHRVLESELLIEGKLLRVRKPPH